MKEIMIQNSGMPLSEVSGLKKPVSATPENTFGEMLKNSIGTVNQLQQNADQAIENLTTGKETDIHRTMIEMEKADVSFQLVMQVRNKLISTYEEIMRMQV